VERVTLRLGSFEQAIAISDLERFAKTGELLDGLQPLAPVLTSQVREVLNRRLQIGPERGRQIYRGCVLRITGGQHLPLEVAIPNTVVLSNFRQQQCR